MSVDVVSDIEPRVQYTAAAAQTDFDYPFPIFADADLVVDVDGVTQALTTDYTVTGAGDDTGGTITFLAAMAGSEVVTIYRDLAIERLTDFQQNGRFSSASFNDELDKIIMIQQQLDSADGRALRVPMNDATSNADMELPVAASRADKFLYFNAQGEPEMAVAVTAGTVLSQSTIGAALYPISAAETTAGLVSGDLSLSYVYGDTRRYGAVGDGVTDDGVAIQAAFDQLAAGGANVVFPPGAYLTSTQLLFTALAYQRCSITGYGAEILTSGAIAGLRITGGGTTGGVSVFGLQINHRGNASATYGFELYGTWNARLQDCSVECDDTASGYAAYRLRNTTAADTATGCFWTLLDHCHLRRRAGGDGTAPDYGVQITGACNATVLRDCNLAATTAVYVTNESGQTYIANALLLDGCHFEGFTNAIKFHADTATSTFSGWRVVNCRAESGTTFVELTGSTTQPAVPGWMSGNYLISSVTNYLVNANSLYVNNFDFSITPDFAQTHVLRSRDGLEIVPISGSGGDALTLWSSGTGRGIQCKTNAGVITSTISWGSGEPTHSAAKGSLYFRADGGANTCLYVNESGSTTWVAK